MNVGFAGLLLTLIFAGVNSYSAEAPCYPGLDCGALREPGQTAVPLVGDALPGFRFTQNFVLDGAQNLVWARDLFAAGNTMQRFAEAYGGRETFSTAYSRMRSDISQLKLGAIAGWRLATQAEVDRLMERLSPPTIYAYFRPRASGLPTRNVVGVLEPGANNDSVKAAGVLYSNSLLGRAKPRDVAGAQLNPYGFWIVRDITRQVEQTEGLRAEGLLQYFEPVETMRVQPIGMFRAHKSANGVDISDGLTESVALSVKPTEEIRSITLYNLRPIPRGALVSAEVAMRGLSASGSPTPIVTVAVQTREHADFTDPAALWKFEKGEFVGIWQMPSNARLEIPEHIARNAVTTGANLYLAFAATYNACEFEVPELIVRYVREGNLLVNRPLP